MSEEKISAVATETETAPKAKRKKWLSVIIFLIVMILLKNDTVFKMSGSSVVPIIMEQKYHKEFTYVGTSDRGLVLVSPKDAPEEVIPVEIIRDGLTLEYRDRYYSETATKYIENWLKENVRSEYASEIFYEGGDLFYGTDELQKSIEESCSLEQVKIGPSAAPKAYEEAVLQIHFFGPREDREAMTKEMHALYQKIDKEFLVEKITVRFLVVDEDILSKVLNLRELYLEGEFVESEMQIKQEKFSGQYWGFGTYQIDSKRAVEDYEYFKSSIKEALPYFYQ